MSAVDALAKVLQVLGKETDGLQVEENALFVEDSHDDFFAQNRRQGRYPYFDLLRSLGEDKAPILWSSPFTYIQAGKDFYSGNDWCM